MLCMNISDCICFYAFSNIDEVPFKIERHESVHNIKLNDESSGASLDHSNHSSKGVEGSTKHKHVNLLTTLAEA